MEARALDLDPKASRWRRRRRRRRWFLGIGTAALGALILGGRLAGIHRSQTDHERFHQQAAQVLEVVEGDLVLVRLLAEGDQAPPERVRLIGVDANGSANAAARTRELCRGPVLLYLETVPTRTRAGELLAYLYTSGGLLVNQALVEEGLAYADRRWEYSYLPTFQQAEAQAFARERGLWSDQDHEARMPEWRQRWLAELRKEPWLRQEWRHPDEP